MRRFVALGLLALFVGQSFGISLAGTLDGWSRVFGPIGVATKWPGLIATIQPPRATPPRVYHTPLPLRPPPDYRDHSRYTRLIPKPNPVEKGVRAARPIDLVKLRSARHPVVSVVQPLGRVLRPETRSRIRPQASPTPPPAVTGMWPWWTYEARSVPGVGQAMVNVANYNFLIEENDVDIPMGGLDLAFRRMYNSLSNYDANNDDGSGPSLYGNRWTNNLDVHLGWSGSGNTVTISLYTGDGARDDYSCTITQVGVCTATTPGVHDLLATTQLGSSGYACQLQWTKKSGTSYIFDAPYPQCTSNDPGYYGKLLAIYGRNHQFYISLTYSWSGNDQKLSNLASITVTHHPDNSQLVLTFGQIAGTTITELMQVARPDGINIKYYYDVNGNLIDIAKPGNNPISFNHETPPQHFLDGNSIDTGNLPETYAIQPGHIEVCGPRAAISIIDTNQNPDDGACVDFDHSNGKLSDWYTRGVLNPTPEDSVTPSPMQTGVSTGFTQWNDTTFVTLVNCSGLGETGTSLTDHYGHQVLWCYDTASRVTQTQVYSGSQWLTTAENWDTNNNLTSTVDARGYQTNMGYDANGNTVEVSLPKQPIVGGGSITPTSFYDYDQYNNVLRYCDPANNGNNSFQTPTDSLCQTYGTHPTAYQFATPDPNEPYGCLTQTTTPSNYSRTITYATDGSCGTGLPTKVTGQTIQQFGTNANRTPTQNFTYNTDGTLQTYDAGNGAWTINYTNYMNRVRSRVDPDRVTTYSCYNLDGSTFYSETAYQHQLDSSPSCPTVNGMKNGATPPPFAVSYNYDANGDVAAELHHHNCTSSTCPANSPAPTQCYNQTVNLGATCKFYDGLDRLVEVKQPYDSTFDLYTNPWITRYLYDITGNTYSFGGASSFSAHGNLFETEELLPAGSHTGVVGGTWDGFSSPSQISNTTYQVLKATAFDAIDRPVAKYSYVFTGQSSDQFNTETLTWDSSPLDPNGVAGLLGTDCNSLNKCLQYDYTPDGQKATLNPTASGEPTLNYTYDADGRIAVIKSSAYTGNSQQYTYTVDGLLSISNDPSGDTNNAETSPATITHHYYKDGMPNGLDVSSAALTQNNLFQYAYRADGRLKEEQIDDTSLQGSPSTYGQTLLTYTYTAAGRVTDRNESGVGADTHQPDTTYNYDPANTGFEISTTSPATTLSQMTYSADSELMSLVQGGTTDYYTYTLRGEHACSLQSCTAPSRTGTMFANSVAVPQQKPQHGVSFQYNWDDGMSVMTQIAQQVCSPCAPLSSWSYDQAGRQNSSQGALGTTGNQGGVTRQYDSQNHVVGTTGPPGTASMVWGPNGHPFTIGTGSGISNNETLHWDGDQMLFSTRQSGQAVVVDDIKIDVQGDVLPQDAGSAGLTFFDRGPGGVVMGCHNAGGAVFAGLGDDWVRGWGFAAADDSPCYSSSGPAMPTSIAWYGTSLISGPRLPALIGKGGVLGMPRRDGLTDNFDTFQGVRSYDSTAGTWTAPDAYAGDVRDPATEKAYMWNGNNPVGYADLSGFDAIFQGDDGAGGEPLTEDWSLTGTVGVDAAPFGEAMTQVTIPNTTPSTSQPTGSDVPSGVVIQPSTERESDKNGIWDDYYYTIINSEGQPVTGEGYQAMEHVSPPAPSDCKNCNSNGLWKDAVNGNEILDNAGLNYPIPPGTYSTATVQLLYVRRHGTVYNIPSELVHAIDVVNGKMTRTRVWQIAPDPAAPAPPGFE